MYQRMRQATNDAVQRVAAPSRTRHDLTHDDQLAERQKLKQGLVSPSLQGVKARGGLARSQSMPSRFADVAINAMDREAWVRTQSTDTGLNYLGTGEAAVPHTNKDFKPETRVADMAFLGAHDAGTKQVKNLEMISVCQHLGLLDQAEQGVQYFDLRVRTNKKGQWKFYHGEKKVGGVHLGGFNASGPAVVETKALFEYAKKHSANLFIFKFHFDLSTNKTYQVANFLNIFTSRYRDQIVKRNDDKAVGQVTMAESVQQQKNMILMAHHAGKNIETNNGYVWEYKANTYGGWGKTPRANSLIKHLANNIEKENQQGKLLVSQTNLPACIPPSLKVIMTPKAWRGLKILADSSHKKVADGLIKAMGEDRNPGVISMDFVGTQHGSTDAYRNAVNKYNQRHLAK